jgi:hypothetical protein
MAASLYTPAATATHYPDMPQPLRRHAIHMRGQPPLASSLLDCHLPCPLSELID